MVPVTTALASRQRFVLLRVLNQPTPFATPALVASTITSAIGAASTAPSPSLALVDVSVRLLPALRQLRGGSQITRLGYMGAWVAACKHAKSADVS